MTRVVKGKNFEHSKTKHFCQIDWLIIKFIEERLVSFPFEVSFNSDLKVLDVQTKGILESSSFGNWWR